MRCIVVLTEYMLYVKLLINNFRQKLWVLPLSDAAVVEKCFKYCWVLATSWLLSCISSLQLNTMLWSPWSSSKEWTACKASSCTNQYKHMVISCNHFTRQHKAHSSLYSLHWTIFTTLWTWERKFVKSTIVVSSQLLWIIKHIHDFSHMSKVQNHIARVGFR